MPWSPMDACRGIEPTTHWRRLIRGDVNNFVNFGCLSVKRVKDKKAVDVGDTSGVGVNRNTHQILTPNEFRLNEVIKLIVGTYIEFVWLTGQERVNNTH